MTDEDARQLVQARSLADQAAGDVREIMASMRRLQASLRDAEDRSRAAHMHLATTEQIMARRYGREVVGAK